LAGNEGVTVRWGAAAAGLGADVVVVEDAYGFAGVVEVVVAGFAGVVVVAAAFGVVAHAARVDELEKPR
jgi:hypothetical protein